MRPDAERLRQRIEEWAKISVEGLRNAQPQLPDELNDRQQDVCEPLLAIADFVGGSWPGRARAALIELCAGVDVPDEATGLRLLVDIRDAFTRMQSDKLPTSQLLRCLREGDDSPWGGLDYGRQLSAFRLSKLLRPFDVRPRDIRFDHGVQKGYLRGDFEDSWSRYLDPAPPEPDHEGQQGRQASVYAGSEHFLEGQQQPLVADAKSGSSPVNMRVVADVAPSPSFWSDSGAIIATVDGAETNGSKHCSIHPRNGTDWWLRGGVDWVCELCHPNPDSFRPPSAHDLGF